MEKKGNAKEVVISAHACNIVVYNSFLNEKLEGFRAITL